MGKDIKEECSNEEQEENISFLNLFKYATKTEKIMVFISVICSILQGFAIPLM